MATRVLEDTVRPGHEPLHRLSFGFWLARITKWPIFSVECAGNHVGAVVRLGILGRVPDVYLYKLECLEYGGLEASSIEYVQACFLHFGMQ